MKAAPLPAAARAVAMAVWLCAILVGPAGSIRPPQARSPGTLRGSDWPQFRGPALTGVSPETGIRKDWSSRPPRILWKVDLTDDGYAGPSVAEDKVFIVDHAASNDIVRALDLATGREVWRFAYSESARNIYGFARATPSVARGRVFTLSREGLLHCLKAQTGTLLWKADLKADFGGRPPMWGYAAPPLLDHGQLIVWPGGKTATVVALDPGSGKVLWQGGEGDVPGYGMPVPATLAGKRQYVMTVWKGFVGAEAGTGRVLWRIPWETVDGTNVACPIVVGNSVFVTSSYNMGCARYEITAEGAREVWRNKAMNAHMNTPILCDGYIYGTGDPGYLMCLDPGDGSVRWRQMGFEKGGVVAVDGVLLAINGSSGDVVMVRLTPQRYEELGRFTPLGGQSWSPPIVAHGKLLIRNRKSLACVDLR